MLGIELEEVKSYLGYSDNTRDATLQLIIDGGIAALKTLMGRRLEYGVYKDTFQYKCSRHYLRESPVEEITQILVGSSDITESTSEYLLFKEPGYLHFKSWADYRNGREWLTEGQYMTVEYIGGYEVLPGDIKLGLFNAIQAADSAQKTSSTYGGPVKRLAVYDVGVTDFAIPKEGLNGVLATSLALSLGSYVDYATSIGGWLLHETEYVGPVPGSPS